MLHWPESLKDVARAILAVDPKDLDHKLQDKRRKGALGPMSDQHTRMAGRQFRDERSLRRDPFAVEATRTLDLVLHESLGATAKWQFICAVLDAAYPRGYAPPDDPAGAQESGKKWRPETIRRWL